LLAVLAGAQTMTDIASFGCKKLGLLRRFRPFANGTPAHDHLGDILAMLDPRASTSRTTLPAALSRARQARCTSTCG